MEPNNIYVGDCVALMRDLPADCIDLTVTSPPYDHLRQYHGYHFDFPAIAAALYRVTKPGGVVVWVVGDATIKGSETGTSFKQALGFISAGFNLHDTMIYQKNSFAICGNKHGYWQGFEYMFVIAKGRPKTINLICDRPNKMAGMTTKHPGSRRRLDGSMQTWRKEITTAPFGRRSNIWSYNPSSSKGHPTPFPEQLADDHIRSWSNPGDLVLDPMCGSGTTCKMAMRSGRNYLGFEIAPEYGEVAKKRAA